MTLEWTFIAICLYAEVSILALLLLPFISPLRWQKVFRSKILNKLSGRWHVYFNVFIVILLLLFFEAIREVYRYSGPTAEVDLKHNPEQENIIHMKLFRAQRNLYIAGFAFFLWFVLRRLVMLISQLAYLMAQFEASQKQAKGAADAAQKLIEEKENLTAMSRLDDTDVDAVKREQDLAKKLDSVTEEVTKLKKELDWKEKDLQTLKKQSEGTNKEYDRLQQELADTQDKLKKMEGSDKKSD